MLTLGVFHVAVWKPFVEDDIADQGGAAVNPFEQVVADQRVLGDAPSQAGLKGGDFIDTLADEDAAAEQVLVDVRNGPGIDVDGGVAAIDSREQRTAGGSRGYFYPRLQHRVATVDAAAARVELGAIERVRQGAHQPRHATGWQRGIGIGRDHEAHAAQLGRIALMQGEWIGLGIQQVAIELLELATLAFPAHPAALTGVVQAWSVQHMERSAIALVETANAFDQCLFHGLVAYQAWLRRIGMVAEQHEAQCGVRIGQIMDFQLLDQFEGLLGARKQCRNDHRRDAIAGDALTEVQLGQHPGRHAQGDQPVHQGDTEHRRRQQRQQDTQPPGCLVRAGQRQVSAR